MTTNRLDSELEVFEKHLIEANSQLLQLHRRMVHIGDDLYEDGQLESFEHVKKVLEDLKNAIYTLRNYHAINLDKVDDEINQIKTSFEVRTPNPRR